MRRISHATLLKCIFGIFAFILGTIIFVAIIGYFNDELNELIFNRKDGLRVPGSSQEYIGSPYSDVFEELTDTGFTNITLKESISSPPNFRWIGKIQKITIDGEKEFFVGKYYKVDSAIIIYYYKDNSK